jgi:hypothetical protein
MPSCSLFQEQRAPSHASNSASKDQAKDCTPNLNAVNHSTNVQEIEMAKVVSHKRQSIRETNGKPKKQSTINGSHHNLQNQQPTLWFGFVIKEELSQNAGHTIQAYKSAQVNIESGIPPAEAL